MPATTESIPEWKQEEVAKLVDLLEGRETVGIVGIAGIPSRQLQVMRRGIHDTAELRVSRNTLLIRALEQVDAGLEDLVEYVSGQIGLVITDDNPFTLYRKLEASKTPAPISAGEVAPNDIVIEAGDTGIDPGPFVGDLQNIGVPARIDEGSIKVMETTTVCEAGETVSPEIESVLNELELEPKEVGLDLRAVFSDDVIFEAPDLEIDVDAFRDDFASAAARGRGLALEAGYPAPAVVPALLARADAQATQLAVAAGIVEPETAGAIFGAALADGRALAGAVDDEAAIPADAIPGGEAVPTAPTAETETADTTEADESEAEAADAADDDDEDDEPAGEGLGNLFG